MFLLATTAADDSCDVSPRGDPAGSVLVVDERTLAFGKAFARAALWDPVSWPAKGDVPTAGRIVRSQHRFRYRRR